MRKVIIATIAAAALAGTASAQNCNNSVAFNARCNNAKPTTQTLSTITVSAAALSNAPRSVQGGQQLVQYNGKWYKIITHDGGSFKLAPN